MSKTLVILDGDNLCYRAYHKFNTLSGGNKPSGLVFGVPSMVRKLITQYEDSTFIAVFDSGKAAFRTGILPTYKLREKSLDFDVESFQEQKRDVMDLLLHMNIIVAFKNGYEADDLIYTLTRFKKKTYTKVIIVSSDKDFNQVIDDRVSIWNPSKDVLLTTKNLKRRFGCEPWQVVDYLTLLGDSSDKIPGYFGMGEKRIADFFSKFSSINEYLQSEEQIKILDKIKLAELRDINKKLISLRYFYLKVTRKDINLMKRTKDMDWIASPFGLETIKNISKKYGIKTFLSQEFLEPFKRLGNG